MGSGRSKSNRRQMAHLYVSDRMCHHQIPGKALCCAQAMPDGIYSCFDSGLYGKLPMPACPDNRSLYHIVSDRHRKAHRSVDNTKCFAVYRCLAVGAEISMNVFSRRIA